MVVCLGVVVGVDGLPNKNSSKFLPFENFSLLLGEVPKGNFALNFHGSDVPTMVKFLPSTMGPDVYH